LKTKLSDATTHRTALQSLNTSVAALATSSTAAAKSGALASFTASSSASSVTARAVSTAAAGTVSFTVTALAAAQISVTQPMSAWDTSATPSITFRTGATGSTKDTTVNFTSSNLDDVVGAINSSGAGVTATKVASGTTNGVQQYRLQLRSSATGSAGQFAISTGTSYDAATALPTTTVAGAADASLTLYGGTGAEQIVTSPSNTFSALLTGVDVTASAVSTTPVTVTVAADATAATTAAQSLSASLITLFSGIAAGSAITASTSSTGSASSTTGSVFTGDGNIRLFKDSLLSAVTGAVGGRSPSSIGITLTRDGTITFDQAKFAAAMAGDPSGTTAMFQTIAGRVSETATSASDPYSGSLTKQITSEQSNESSITDQISTWDSRLATIQAQYTTQFNALETALNALSSQASYITSQIAGLTTNYQKS
jgi:flagellar hook-associated protein 2